MGVKQLLQFILESDFALSFVDSRESFDLFLLVNIELYRQCLPFSTVFLHNFLYERQEAEATCCNGVVALFTTWELTV